MAWRTNNARCQVYPEEDPLHGSEATVENMEVAGPGARAVRLHTLGSVIDGVLRMTDLGAMKLTRSSNSQCWIDKKCF